MIRSEIRRLLIETVRRKFGNIDIPEFSIEVPENSKHGDYATNIALVLAKIIKKPTLEIAAAIVAPFNTPYSKFNARSAPPGFINFCISPEILYEALKEVLKKKDKYGAGAIKKEKISLEYVDANPTGPIHIGHARSGFLGDALSRALIFSGYKVSREFYINNSKTSTQIKSLGRTALGRGEEYKHAQLLSILAKTAVKNKLKKIKDEGEAGFLIARLLHKENKRFLKDKARISYDVFFEEQSVYAAGAHKKIIAELGRRGVLYEKDGALWFRASQYGDVEDRVLIRQTGDPTYLLADIVYHLDRLTRRKYDLILNLFGADHHGYGPRLKAALMALGIDSRRVRIVVVQVARLVRKGKEVKMSKRKGEFVTLEELIGEVGLDAARWFFLEKSPDTHMDFDLDLAKERSVKNPVYYVQYAHARISRILEKASGARKVESSKKTRSAVYNLLSSPEELSLVRKLIRFPEVIEDTAHDYQVHRLTRYAQDLAHSFHDFYEKHRVITEDKELTQARLALVRATQIVLRSVLGLLGISTPRRM